MLIFNCWNWMDMHVPNSAIITNILMANTWSPYLNNVPCGTSKNTRQENTCMYKDATVTLRSKWYLALRFTCSYMLVLTKTVKFNWKCTLSIIMSFMRIRNGFSLLGQTIWRGCMCQISSNYRNAKSVFNDKNVYVEWCINAWILIMSSWSVIVKYIIFIGKW